MIRIWKLSTALLLAVIAAPTAGFAGHTSGADVVLYEVTEDMYLLGQQGSPVSELGQAVRRGAQASLSGWAKLGTPLCPEWVLYLAPQTKHCVVNAVGGSNLGLVPGPDLGRGRVWGSFTVVVQDLNVVDAPEFVILTGKFEGDANLVLAFMNQAPIGFVTNGTGAVDGGPAFAFSGTFRLPFALATKGKRVKARWGRDAYYLGDDFATPMPVTAHERSLGYPTVRFDLKFVP